MNQLSKTERKELKRQERQAERERTARRRTLERLVTRGAIAFAAAGAIGGVTWYLVTRPAVVKEEIVSRSGLHWHSELRIYIKGKPQDIPANIGIGVVHNPVHTHEPGGPIHLEFDGLVTIDDLRLREFFKAWGKRLDRDCVFEYCNGPDGTVTMFRERRGEPGVRALRHERRRPDRDHVPIALLRGSVQALVGRVLDPGLTGRRARRGESSPLCGRSWMPQ
jgi:hypothetical protein